MARLTYTCECGYSIDGRETALIAQHSSTCTLGQLEELKQVVEEAVLNFIGHNDPTRVRAVTEALVQLDMDLAEFYTEGDENAMTTALAVKLFDHMEESRQRLNRMEEAIRLSGIEMNFDKITPPSNPTTEDGFSTRESRDPFENKMYNLSQDNKAMIQKEEEEEDDITEEG